MFDSIPEPPRFPPVAGLTTRAAFDGGTMSSAELERQADALRAQMNERHAELTRLQSILQRSWRERLWARVRRWRGRP